MVQEYTIFHTKKWDFPQEAQKGDKLQMHQAHQSTLYLHQGQNLPRESIS